MYENKFKIHTILFFAILYIFTNSVVVQSQLIVEDYATQHRYLILDNEYTFQDAKEFAKNTTPPANYKNGYLLAIEDVLELKFIISMLGPTQLNLGNTDIWLGIESLDSDQLNWGWINGSTRTQPVYTTFPERCYLYCGDFTGNIDKTKPYLWFTGVTDEANIATSYQWNAATPSTTKFVIIEYEPVGRNPIIQMKNAGDVLMTISNIDEWEDPDLRIYYRMESTYDCTIISRINGVITCSFDTIYFDRVLVLKIEANAKQSVHYYYYNSPWITAYFFVSGPSTYRFYGYSLELIPSGYQILTIGGIQYSVSSFAFSSDTPQFLQSSLQYLDPTTAAIPFTIDYTSTAGLIWHLKVARPALLDTESKFYYGAPYPGLSLSYTAAAKMAELNSLSESTANMTIVYGPQMKTLFSLNFFGGNEFNIWTQMTRKPSGSYSFFDVEYVGPVGGNVNGPRFYYNSTDQTMYGVDTTSTLELPFIPVFGLASGTTMSVTPQIYNVTATVQVYFDKNFMYPQSAIQCVYPDESTNQLVLNWRYKYTELVTTTNIYPPFVVFIISNMDDSSQKKSFNLTLNYYEPIITSVTCDVNIVSIVGVNFGTPYSFNGVKCGADQLMTTELILCELNEKPNSEYFFNVTIGSFTSNNYSVTTGTYMYINSITPTELPLDGGELTFEILNMVTDRIEMQAGDVQCSNLTPLNSTFFKCLAPNMAEGAYLPVVANIQPGNVFVLSPDRVLQFYDIKVYEVLQQNKEIQLIGEFLNLYYPDWTFKIGGTPPASVNCVNSTFCTVVFASNNLNGDFTIKSKNNFGQYQELSKTWNPVILNDQGLILDPTIDLDLDLLFFDNSNTAELSGFPLSLITSNGNQFKYTVPPFVGKHQLKLKTPTVSTTIGLSYNPPQVTSVDVTSNYELIVKGNRLGFVEQSAYPNVPSTPPALYGLTAQPRTAIDYNYTQITLPLSKSARSGSLIISANGLNSTSVFTNIPMTINSISRPPVTGGKITIMGNYIAFESFDSQTIYNITIAGQPCGDLKFLSNSFEPYEVECNAPRGTGEKQIVFKSILTNYNETQPIIYQSPVIASSTSTAKNTPGVISIFGENFADTAIKVIVGSGSKTSECLNPKSNFEGTLITCTYSSDLLADGPQGISLSVNVSVDNLTYQSNVFIYSNQPPNCDPQCAINGGTCNTTTIECQCPSGYTGIVCDIEVPKGELQPLDLGTPEIDKINMTLTYLTDSTIKNQFRISVHSLREVSAEGEVVEKSKMDDIQWTQESIENNEPKVYTYIGRPKSSIPSLMATYNRKLLSQDDLRMTVKMMLYSKENTTNFKGDVFTIPSHSIKYEISVSNWKFKQSTNKLQMLVLSQNTDIVDSCGIYSTKVSQSLNSDGKLRRMNIMQDQSMLNAFYSDRLTVDGRLTYSQVELLTELDQDQKELNQQNTDDFNVLTAINIPYFENNATIDPNFSALVTVESKNSEVCGSSKRKWVIPVAVVVSVVGAAAIGVGTYLFFKKKYRLQFKLASYKLKRMSMKRYDFN